MKNDTGEDAFMLDVRHAIENLEEELKGTDSKTLSTIQAIRDADILITEVSSRLDLKSMDHGYRFDCPFCGDTEASFHLLLSDTDYECYSCGARGDVIQFMIEYKRMSLSLSVV